MSRHTCLHSVIPWGLKVSMGVLLLYVPLTYRLKAGRVVVVLNGRQAGKKAVVVNTWEGSKERQFAFCLVAGVEKAPLKVHKKMPAKKIEKRMRVKPFIKYINVNHLMPTRYAHVHKSSALHIAKEREEDGQERTHTI